MAAGIAGNNVEVVGEDVDDLAFALIAPLGAHNHRTPALVQALSSQNGRR
jgi:hypothetical protein